MYNFVNCMACQLSIHLCQIIVTLWISFINLYLHNNLFTRDGCFFHYNDNQTNKKAKKKKKSDILK